MATTYKIVLNGIKDGEDLLGVVRRVMSLVKLPRDRVSRMLTNPGIAVKRGLDAQKAAKYEAVLERAGCNVIMAPDFASVALPEDAPDEVDHRTRLRASRPEAGANGLLGRLANIVGKRGAEPLRANYEEMMARARSRDGRAKLRSLVSLLSPGIGRWIGRLRG